MTRLLALLALPLAACATTDDTPAPVAPVHLVAPTASSLATMQQPIARVDTFQVLPAPPVIPPARIYNTDGTSTPYIAPQLPPMPGVLPPLRRQQ